MWIFKRKSLHLMLNQPMNGLGHLLIHYSSDILYIIAKEVFTHTKSQDVCECRERTSKSTAALCNIVQKC